MMLGRDLCGLPVFSWQEGNYIGRVADFFINGKTKKLFGISLGKTFPCKRHRYVDACHIFRIYKDGVIVSSADRVENLRYLGEDAVSYLDFTKDPAVFLREGEIVSDLIFDDRFCIDGYEISGGLWNDLVRGRCYRPRCGKIRQISK